jgi:hypothetical protein
MVITNPDMKTFSVLFNNGEGAFPVVNGSYSTQGSAWGVFCADFEGDGDLDIAISNGDSETVEIFLNDGHGIFSPAEGSPYATPGNSWGLYCGDFNNDGVIDVANANSDSNGVTILWNEPLSSCSYLLGDINSDGQRIGGDVTYGVRYFKGIGLHPPDSCYMDSTGSYLFVSGDCNGNCEFRGSDITRLVAYFKGTAELAYCHFFPPPYLREVKKLLMPTD